ncbi:MAG TPA: hypothetical protein PLW44_04045 [Chitinophagales bacterium]|nr:hypothetical protein [Chitinophagales bacterium]
MPFLNSAQGIIKDALVFDRTGESLPSIIQIAKGLQPGSRLFCLLVKHIHVLPVVAEQMIKSSQHIVHPFAKNQCAATIRELLLYSNDKDIYSKLFESIIPKSLVDEKKLIYATADMVKQYPEEIVPRQDKEVNIDKSKFQFLDILDWTDIGDRVHVESQISQPTTAGSTQDVSQKYNVYIYSPEYFDDFVRLFKMASEYTIMKLVLDREGVLNSAPKDSTNTTRVSLKNGDVISGEDFLLIGIRSYIGYRNFNTTTPLSLKKFVEIVRKSHYNDNASITIEVLGSELPVFSGQQSFYHLDMYLNYGGRTSAGRHLLFLAFVPNEVITQFGQKAEKRAELLALQRHLEVVYNKIKNITLADGSSFEVERIPVLIDQWQNIFSFNNCITENNGAIAKCYIPHYTNVCSSITDTPQQTTKLAEDYYRQAYSTIHLSGFDMIPITIDKLLNAASNQSLHCSVAILRRV